MTLIIFTGLPASGKSTLAQKLQSSLPDTVFLSSDKIRNHLFQSYFQDDRGEEVYSEDHKEIVYRTMSLLATYLLPVYDHVLIDATYHLESRRSQLINAVGNLLKDRSNYLFVETFASEVTIKQRMKRRETENSESDARYREYLLLQQSWEDIEDPNYCRISTEQSVEDSLKEIKSCLDRQVEMR